VLTYQLHCRINGKDNEMMTPTALALALILAVMPFIKGSSTDSLSALKQRALATLQTQTPPGVQLNPATLNFGKQVVRKGSPPKRITLTNVGGTSLYINSAAIAGDNWRDFTLVKDGCSAKQVAPGQSCLITVRFTPARIEDRNATLTLTDNAPDSPQSVSLKGTGINSIDVAPF
jgi:hypothetical protein